MKTQWKEFRDNSWFVLKFPKRNKALIFNTETKKYEFYDLRASDVLKPEKKVRVVNLRKYRVAIALLVGVLGVSLAYNLFNFFSI
tara:strand:- start:3867 stop:4121 length:255 start_codon:yes stop_codon:yes gene_type:complete